MTFDKWWSHLGFSHLCNDCEKNAAYEAWLYQQSIITEVEDLFLAMYENGSAHPGIEAKVEALVDRVVTRQSGGTRNAAGNLLL